MTKSKLRFKELDIEGRASISTDLTDEEARGIYVYEFTDGTYYVGKSNDVRSRHVQHLHEYRHMDPQLFPKKMLWAPFSGTDQELDFAETQTIAKYESDGKDLRNKMKTGRPGGSLEVIVDTGEGWGVPIPWDRERLPKSTRTFTYDEDVDKLKQFKKLQALPEYDQLLEILAWYVQETIPAPADTAGSLWIASAMPSTYGRICCITCQNAETFVVFEDGAFDKPGPWGFINIKPEEDLMVPDWCDVELGYYENLRTCIRFMFNNLNEMAFVLSISKMLDCCYRVNSELMRKGASMMRRYNNPYLVEAILNCTLPPYKAVERDVTMAIVSKDIADPSKQLEYVGIEHTVAPSTFYLFGEAAK